jgi:hypothetical protein
VVRLCRDSLSDSLSTSLSTMGDFNGSLVGDAGSTFGTISTALKMYDLQSRATNPPGSPLDERVLRSGVQKTV